MCRVLPSNSRGSMGRISVQLRVARLEHGLRQISFLREFQYNWCSILHFRNQCEDQVWTDMEHQCWVAGQCSRAGSRGEKTGDESVL
jgi:hypothetical protein